MASIRKRTWDSGGQTKTAWVVDYFDQHGKRRLKTFASKKAAEGWARTALYEVDRGIHTHDRDSVTVREAGEIWIEASRLGRNGREPVEPHTLRAYEGHTVHINSLMGDERLNRMTAAKVAAFRDDLVKRHSRSMARKILTSFKSMLNEAVIRGLVAQNHGRGVGVVKSDRHRDQVTIPSRAEMKAILTKADELAGQANKQYAKRWRRWRALVYAAAMTGMRASELRGLPWQNVDLKGKTIRVRQRADERGVIGPTKSSAGRRDIPVPDILIKVLKEWKVECPPGDLVFPNWQSHPESLANVYNRCWAPLLDRAGVTLQTGKTDDSGAPALAPAYNFHALRHFHASRLIASGANPKEVQSELGHSSIQVTYDLYGHLFEEDLSGRRERAERLAAELA